MGDNLDIFKFDSLARQTGLVHGIFGRAGGSSPRPWDSLNVGAEVGDDAGNVRENYERICAALGVRRGDLATARQVHSDRVARVTGADRGSNVGQLDGLITNEVGVALSLRFADCVPIIAYDPEHHALGVAHAGWRGTVSKIATRLVQAMGEAFGSRPERLIAGIGPSIGPCCYEVGSEVVEAARSAFEPEVERQDGWPLIFHNGSAQHLDLWAANKVLLENAGVDQVETARVCTACHRERFFSHRADGGKTGRFAMIAALR